MYTDRIKKVEVFYNFLSIFLNHKGFFSTHSLQRVSFIIPYLISYGNKCPIHDLSKTGVHFGIVTLMNNGLFQSWIRIYSEVISKEKIKNIL